MLSLRGKKDGVISDSFYHATHMSIPYLEGAHHVTTRVPSCTTVTKYTKYVTNQSTVFLLLVAQTRELIT